MSTLPNAPGSSAQMRIEPYWPRCARALRSGGLEIRISPSNGVYTRKRLIGLR
jgi:hypothetical protein